MRAFPVAPSLFTDLYTEAGWIEWCKELQRTGNEYMLMDDVLGASHTRTVWSFCPQSCLCVSSSPLDLKKIFRLLLDSYGVVSIIILCFVYFLYIVSNGIWLGWMYFISKDYFIIKWFFFFQLCINFLSNLSDAVRVSSPWRKKLM